MSGSYRLKVRSKLPEAPEAEKGLLGSILLNSGPILERCLESQVTEDWFNHPCRKVIYRSLLEMRGLQKPVDLISVTQHLDDKQILHEIGGPGEIADLFSFVPSSSNAPYYIEVLREKCAIRTAMKEAEKVKDELSKCLSLQEAYNLTTGAFQKSQELCVVEEPKLSRKKEAILDFYDEVEKASTGTKPKVVPTPFQSINDKVGGYGQSEIVVISGPKSSGKSLAAMQSLCKAVFEYGKSGAAFSLEMPARQYIRRMTSYLGDISLNHLQWGRLTKGEFNRFGPTLSKIEHAPLEVFDFKNCRMTVDDIERQIRRVKKNNGLDFVVLDYLQLIKTVAKSDKRRDQEISEVTIRAKQLCNELEMNIIVLCAENYDGKIRESGGVEYDADTRFQIKLHKQTEKPDHIWVDKMRDGEAKYKVPVKLNGDMCRLEECEEAA